MSDRLQAATGGEAGSSGGRFDRWIGGRANRKGYWLWVGPLLIGGGGLSAAGVPIVEYVFGFGIFLVWIRRLHDLGWTGWIAPLINIAVAIIGLIEATVLPQGLESGLVRGLAALAAILVLGVLPGQARTNRYGPPPGKRADSDLAETFA